MTRRLGPVFAGIAVVAVLGVLLVGVDGISPVPVTGLVILVPLVALAFTGFRRTPVVAERAWSAPALAQPRSDADGDPVVPNTRSVALALGRVEARELMSSPWFGVGMGFCVLNYLLFGIVFANDNGEVWEGFGQLAPWFAHPLVGMTVLAGHRAVTRSARDGADELFDSCPTDAVTRTVGLMFSAAVPVVAFALFFAALLATVAVRSPHLHGPIGVDSLADVAGALVLCVGGSALGVALGRWVRFALAPVVAIVGIALATLALNDVGGNGWNPLVPLSTAPTVEGPSPVFADRPTMWHLLWLTALTAIVVVVAVARHRRGRRVITAGVAAAVVAVVAGIGATRPLSSASAAHIADLIARPEAHQDCAATDGPVKVCVYGYHRELLDPVVDRVEPIASVLPASVSPLTLRQVFDGDLDDLPPEVRRLLTEADLVWPGGELGLDFSFPLNNVIDDPGFDVAFAALGLPLEPDDQSLPTVIAGEARGVVALWLATRGLDGGHAARATTSPNAASPDAFDRGSVEDDPCIIPSVVWSAQDLAAARAVLALPETDVQRVVDTEWARWSDPRTGTDELLTALGLPGVGPFDRVEARPDSGC